MIQTMTGYSYVKLLPVKQLQNQIIQGLKHSSILNTFILKGNVWTVEKKF
jgi:hypothetical protein